MARPPIPSKLTPERQEALCRCLRLGMPVIHACNSVGISHTTFRRWKQAGARYDDAVYVEFLAAIKRAGADFVESNMGHIERAAQGKSWQAAAWLLERRLPEEFGLKEVAQINVLAKEIVELKAIVNDRAKRATSANAATGSASGGAESQ